MLNNLIKRRIEKNIKQKDLAKFIGYTSTSYSNIEKGNRNINIDLLYKLAYILDINPLSILEIIPEILPLDNHSKKYIKKKYDLKDEEIEKLSSNANIYNITK